MKALTIWQPWASLLALGQKKYETRSRPFRYRGLIAIHAAQYRKLPPDIYQALYSALKTKGFHEPSYEKSLLYHLEQGFMAQYFGTVIAETELVDCHLIDEAFVAKLPPGEVRMGDFTPGRFAFEFADMKCLNKPVPVKGAQGLWNWEV